jgi:hypothetical protein
MEKVKDAEFLLDASTRSQRVDRGLGRLTRLDGS